jgi:hypothetical protein
LPCALSADTRQRNLCRAKPHGKGEAHGNAFFSRSGWIFTLQEGWNNNIEINFTLKTSSFLCHILQTYCHLCSLQRVLGAAPKHNVLRCNRWTSVDRSRALINFSVVIHGVVRILLSLKKSKHPSLISSQTTGTPKAYSPAGLLLRV